MVKPGADFGPSEILAALACRLYEWDEAGEILPAWVAKAEEASLAEVESEGGIRAVTAAEAMEEGRRTLAATSDLRKLKFARFYQVMSALQRLDEWHEPLRLGAGPATVLTDAHEDALYRLTVEGSSYNLPGRYGSIIPPVGDELARSRTSPDAGIVAQLLHHTAFLPPATAAGDPNDPNMPSDRTVELRYVGTSSRSGDPRGPIGVLPTVAVAPVLQGLDDATLLLRDNPARYGVELRYDVKRLERIVAKAIGAGAHILFMPEMAVDSRRVSDLASAIRRAAAAHAASKGSLPALRFVVAGVSHFDGTRGGNSIVVLDIEGRQLFQQDKLCRWNLKWYHQCNYGIRPACSDGEPDLTEDIAGGRTVWIADLEHLGRFLTLICADMDYDKPGDWLIRNVAVDWLHAPIMDKSIAWGRDKDGELQPWIVDRAHRAGTLGVPRVVVTNSLFLTLRLNEHNALPGSGHPTLSNCAIAFMLDAESPAMEFREIDIDLPSPSLVVSVVRWLEGFEPFPPP